jgi:Raf kinase inhibitor-like YbhB/YbcL family protein
MDPESSNSHMQLLSPAFEKGDDIPMQYTCKGDNISPPLNIVDVPTESKSLALIMHDPDAPDGDFLHWLVWDIPAATQAIGAGSIPVGAVQGLSGFNKNEYGGPCPPGGTGVHHYIFDLYALDTTLNLSPNTTHDQLERTIKSHIIQQASLTGVFAAD